MDTMKKSTNEDDAPLLDRNLYRTIKKMDKATLEGLLNDIFERGCRSGIEEAQGDIPSDTDLVLNLREVEKEIRASDYRLYRGE